MFPANENDAHVNEEMNIVKKLVEKNEQIKEAINNDYELCGYIDAEQNKVIILNIGQRRQDWVTCPASANKLNFHTHPTSRREYFNAFPSTKDIQSLCLLSVSGAALRRRFAAAAAANIEQQK